MPSSLEITDRETVYVAGYPKSGTTWATRLIGDIANSPTGGFRPSEDDREIATEGRDRPGPFIVRKGHYVLDDDEFAPPVSGIHRLGYKNPAVRKIFFVVRDPRDIIVSGSFHWKSHINNFADSVFHGGGPMRALGSWSEYIDDWMRISDRFLLIKYEDLHTDWVRVMGDICRYLGIDPADRPLHEIYERQSFKSRVADVMKNGDHYPLGKEFNMKFMRKGQVGDWRNHLRGTTLDRVYYYLGKQMKNLGYTY